MKQKTKIEVRINIFEYPQEIPFEPLFWERWIVDKLKKGGIPIKGNFFSDLESGTIHRIDDPTDWGSCTYVWEEVP
jgi:hypothetical protein